VLDVLPLKRQGSGDLNIVLGELLLHTEMCSVRKGIMIAMGALLHVCTLSAVVIRDLSALPRSLFGRYRP